jgi:mannose-1-phosphate guanylyltransferase/mannose-6-phosphate isomerase
MPKQFVSLVGDQSTFQQVVGRVTDTGIFGRPIVITNSDFRFVVAEQLLESGVEADIVLEPMRRDSALAVAVAAIFAAERDPAAIVLIFAADHVLQEPRAFIAAWHEAATVAAEGRIVTSASTRPRRPPITATYGRVQNSTVARRSQSRPLLRSPMPKPRVATWPIIIFGTAAISRSAPM